MKTIHKYRLLLLAIALLISWQAFSGNVLASSVWTRTTKSPVNAGSLKQVKSTAYAHPAPFMYLPYVGSASLKSRTIAFFDHDISPGTVDNYFVRYDGYTSHTPAANCQPGVNCKDGSDGYIYNLNYETVLSPAAGRVTQAGWYDPANHSSALGLYLGINYGNGLESFFGNLSALNVASGDNVGIQTQIGTSGDSGAVTGPQLSMSTYYLPSFSPTDPNGWLGKKPDPNIVPDTTLWVASPVYRHHSH